MARIGEQSGPTAANRVRTSLSAYFVWLLGEGVLEANPVAHTNKAVENAARKHVIFLDELQLILRALGDDQYSVILKLMLLTGARREEIGGLCWSEISFAQKLITLPPSRTKNKREHLIPMSPAVVALLKAQPRRRVNDGTERDHIFGCGNGRGWQDWSGSKADLDARIKGSIRPWVPHDFRRLLSTKLHGRRFRTQQHIVEVLLGHAGGHRAGVAGVYNKALYLPERRRALERWAAFIMSLEADVPVRLPKSKTAANLHQNV